MEWYSYRSDKIVTFVSVGGEFHSALAVRFCIRLCVLRHWFHDFCCSSCRFYFIRMKILPLFSPCPTESLSYSETLQCSFYGWYGFLLLLSRTSSILPHFFLPMQIWDVSGELGLSLLMQIQQHHQHPCGFSSSSICLPKFFPRCMFLWYLAMCLCNTHLTCPWILESTYQHSCTVEHITLR